jgi:general secretion pathway protein D
MVFLRNIFIFILFFIASFYTSDPLVSVKFNGEKLEDILQKIAEIKDINIFLPQDLLKSEFVVNFSIPNQIPLSELEEYLIYFLGMAGYVLSIQNGVFVVSKKNDDMIRRYPLPLYVDVNPSNLPDNCGYIRAIYFLKNLKVQGNRSIAQILLGIMPGADKGIIVEPRSNCVILTGPSNGISAAMTVVLEIDQYGIQDEVLFLPLKNISVSIVAKLIEDILAIAKESTAQAAQGVPYNGATYFSPQIKVVQDIRNNALIFLGKKNAIEKLSNFVKNEIDLPQEAGQNIIHIYDLKYLDSIKTAPILNSLVSGRVQSGQSVKDNSVGGPYRVFDGVRILAEERISSAAGDDQKKSTNVKLGGNRLIIAATKDDYSVIEKIIQEIDKPQPQVILEVLILDLTIDENNNFSSQFRIPSIFNFPGNVGFQSVMMDGSPVIINNGSSGPAISSSDSINTNATLKSDLLSTFSTAQSSSSSTSGSPSTVAATASSIADNTARTGILISLGEQFKNMSIAAILQLDQSMSTRNVIANPYSVTLNNVKTEIKNVQIKRGLGNIDPNNSQYGGGTVVKYEDYAATLGLAITPRISFGNDSESNDNLRLNLEIEISIEDFKDNDSTNNFDTLTRKLKTNANMASGNLLILGGLRGEQYTKTVAKTPFLGDIPIIGSLFRRTVTSKNETNLVICIRPIVAENQVLKKFSDDRKKYINNQFDDFALLNCKDPITRFHFKNENDFDVLKKGDEVIISNNENYDQIKKIYHNEKAPKFNSR